MAPRKRKRAAPPKARVSKAASKDDDEVQIVAEKSRDEVLAARFQAAQDRGDVVELVEPPTPHGRVEEEGEDTDDDDEVQIVGEKSQAEVLAARYQAARDRGDVVELLEPSAIDSAMLAPAAKPEPTVKPEPRPAAPPAPSLAPSALVPHTAVPQSLPMVLPMPPAASMGVLPTPRYRLPRALAGDGPETIVQVLADNLRDLDIARGSIVIEVEPAAAAALPEIPGLDMFAHAALIAQLPPPQPVVRLRKAPFPMDMSQSRCSLKMLGLDVHFPFAQPLASQTRVMVAVLRSLQGREACLVESPTGTGKTVALLCAALAWQRRELAERGTAPKIYYGIRTHSQVRSVIRELGRTPYRPAMSFLASREKQCLNRNVGIDPASTGAGTGGQQVPSLSNRCRVAMRAADQTRRTQLERGSRNDEAPGSQCGCHHYNWMASRTFADALSARTRPCETPSQAPPDPGGAGAGASALGRAAGVFDIEDLAAIGANPRGLPGGGRGGGGGGRGRGGRGGERATQSISDDEDEDDDDEQTQPLAQLQAQLTQAECARVHLTATRAGAVFVVSAPPDCGLEPDDEVRAVHLSGGRQLRPEDLGAGAANLALLAGSNGGLLWLAVARGGSAQGGSRRQKMVGCPYHASVALATGADLVFCPFNYLIDPGVRLAMKVSVQGAIVILDEAHNIESVCRDAGSAQVELQKLLAALEWARTQLSVTSRSGRRDLLLVAAQRMAPLLSCLCGALVSRRGLFEGSEPQTGFGFSSSQPAAGFGGASQQQQPQQPKPQAMRERERRAKFSTPPDERSLLYKWPSSQTAKALLELVGAQHSPGPTALRTACDAIQEVLSSPEAAEHGGNLGSLLEGALAALNSLALCAAQPDKFAIAVQVWDNRSSAFPRRNPNDTIGILPASWGCDGRVAEWGLELCVWLLAPEVIFNALAESTHALILTSGTLSPLGAMERELGPAFTARMHATIPPVQADHVLGAPQLLVRHVGVSLNGCKLACTSEQLGRPEVAMELGLLLARLTAATPRRSGVLAFVSSFASARRLCALWQNGRAHATHWEQVLRRPWHGRTIWAELEATKALLLLEGQGDNPASADDVRRYREAVDSGGGALCLAVYRGKLSEGISFNDDYARMVVCVGLPFPSLVDEQVKAKRAYNDLPASRLLGLLPGNDWYRQQAFRALNQALGRCVRHRDDWGTLVLVDDRFAQSGERSFLSQWLQKLLPAETCSVEQLAHEAAAHLTSAPRFVEQRARDDAAALAVRKLRQAAAASQAAALLASPVAAPALVASSSRCALSAAGAAAQARLQAQAQLLAPASPLVPASPGLLRDRGDEVWTQLSQPAQPDPSSCRQPPSSPSPSAAVARPGVFPSPGTEPVTDLSPPRQSQPDSHSREPLQPVSQPQAQQCVLANGPSPSDIVEGPLAGLPGPSQLPR